MVPAQITSRRLAELEAAAVVGFSDAVDAMTAAMEALLEIESSGAWRERTMLDEHGALVPVHTDFARQYLPWFAEEYASVVGNVGAATLRHRVRWAKNCRALGFSVREAMGVSTTDQIALEQVIRFGTDGLTFKHDPDADPGAALQLIRDTIEGNATAVTIKSEYGVSSAPYYVVSDGKVFAVYEGANFEVYREDALPRQVVSDLTRRLRVREA